MPCQQWTLVDKCSIVTQPMAWPGRPDAAGQGPISCCSPRSTSMKCVFVCVYPCTPSAVMGWPSMLAPVNLRSSWCACMAAGCDCFPACHSPFNIMSTMPKHKSGDASSSCQHKAPCCSLHYVFGSISMRRRTFSAPSSDNHHQQQRQHPMS